MKTEINVKINTSKMASAYADLYKAEIENEYQQKLIKENSRFACQPIADRAEKRLAECAAAFNEATMPLTVAISNAEGKAKVRKITARQVIEILNYIEEKLAIPKKALDDVIVSVDINAQGFPRCYVSKNSFPESTQFSAIYKSGSWRILSVKRANCRPENGKISIVLSDEAEIAVIRRIESGRF